jgi:hypothetical protein
MTKQTNTFFEINDKSTGFSSCDDRGKNSSSDYPINIEVNQSSARINLTTKKNFNEDLSQSEEKKIYQKLFKFSGYEKLKKSAV